MLFLISYCGGEADPSDMRPMRIHFLFSSLSVNRITLEKKGKKTKQNETQFQFYDADALISLQITAMISALVNICQLCVRVGPSR